jgi:hypothetical protein
MKKSIIFLILFINLFTNLTQAQTTKISFKSISVSIGVTSKIDGSITFNERESINCIIEIDDNSITITHENNNKKMYRILSVYRSEPGTADRYSALALDDLEDKFWEVKISFSDQKEIPNFVNFVSVNFSNMENVIEYVGSIINNND